MGGIAMTKSGVTPIRRFSEAEAMYKRGLEIEPRSSYAWAALVWLRVDGV
jgi:hypothetical protein